MKRVFFILTLLLFLLPGCLKEPDRGTITIEMPIKSELPVMLTGSILKDQTHVVIHNQTTLDSVFTSEQIKLLPELQNIDFTKYDVLAGADNYTWGITAFEHHFYQNTNSIYVYKLYVHSNLTLQTGVFYYGIIIDKLPAGSHIIFDVEKLE
jgi:hypothetical protein